MNNFKSANVAGRGGTQRESSINPTSKNIALRVPMILAASKVIINCYCFQSEIIEWCPLNRRVTIPSKNFNTLKNISVPPALSYGANHRKKYQGSFVRFYFWNYYFEHVDSIADFGIS